MEEFERRKKEMRRELRAARSNIHISFDVWSSPNCYAIMTIIAHYIDSSGVRKTKLIALEVLKANILGRIWLYYSTSSENTRLAVGLAVGLASS